MWAWLRHAHSATHGTKTTSRHHKIKTKKRETKKKEDKKNIKYRFSRPKTTQKPKPNLPNHAGKKLKTHKQQICIIASPKRPQIGLRFNNSLKRNFFLGKNSV